MDCNEPGQLKALTKELMRLQGEENAMSKIKFDQIKLIIWDLDQTLWDGILSDHNARMPEENRQLIRNIVDCGVMCSICSKNDETEVVRFLQEQGIADLFVFKSINWTPKGERVRQIINNMSLRPVNVLFIDDNESNLAEVQSACENIQVTNVDVLTEMRAYFENSEKKDTAHKRLNQYILLEKKLKFKAEAGSNEEFLFNSNVQVRICYDCKEHIDRIEELVLRSNQLNFTKRRDNKEQIAALIDDDEVKTGYVTVQDIYGDYGIVGFFAIRENACIHFTFSCRIMNMGVEQYVYYELGEPDIEINGDVATSLSTEKPAWINQDIKRKKENKMMSIGESKILLKGPCDLQQLFSYIKETPETVTEFSFVNEKGVNIESGNHSAMILQSLTISPEKAKSITEQLPFCDEQMFHTAMFDDDIGTVVFSLFMESHLGIYKEKDSDTIFAFGEFTNDLTDERNWEGFLNRSLFDANYPFSLEDLKTVKDHYEYVGRITPTESFENIKKIHRVMNGKRLILNCGSETPYLGISHKVNKDKHEYNKELNDMLREWVKTTDNVFLIDVNEFIHGQEDFINSITHFKKRIYFEMSKKLIEIMKSGEEDIQISNGNRIAVDFRQFMMRVRNKINRMIKRGEI